MIAFLSQRRKAIAALVSVLLSWSLIAYFPDGVVTRPEWAALVVGLSGVFGVHSISNDPLATDDAGYQPLFGGPSFPPDATAPAVPLAADPSASWPSQTSWPPLAPAPPLSIPVAA